MLGKNKKDACSDVVILDGLEKFGSPAFEKAVSCLYDNCRTNVMARLRDRGAREPDAEDVFQEAIMALMKNLLEKDVKITTTICGYIYKIALYIWLNQRRRKGQLTEMQESDLPREPELPKIFEETLDLDLIVAECREQLSGSHRDVLDDYNEGLSMEEIAKKRNYKNAQVARQTKLRALKEMNNCAQSKI